MYGGTRMRYVSLIIALLVWCGCASGGQFDRFGVFAPEVESFDKAAKSRGYNLNYSGLDIKFATGQEALIMHQRNWVGECKPYWNLVLVDKQYWDKVGYVDHTELIWHELGHCLLGLDDSTLKKDGHPFGIMYGSMDVSVDKIWYINHLDEYIRYILPNKSLDNQDK